MSHYFMNDNTVKNEEFSFRTQLNGVSMEFVSNHGVFSKRTLDFGTRCLLENLPAIHGDVLDFGCGYGAIGVYLKKKFPCFVDMLDVNDRCLNLARKNAVKNDVDVTVFKSDIYENVTKRYDFIVTNPPIRIGKEKLLEILVGAKEHLKENGELWFVIHKDQGAKSCFQLLRSYYEMTLIKKNKGFHVICARKH